MEQSGFWNWKEFENLFVLQYLDTMENCGTLHMSQGLRTLIIQGISTRCSLAHIPRYRSTPYHARSHGLTCQACWGLYRYISRILVRRRQRSYVYLGTYGHHGLSSRIGSALFWLCGATYDSARKRCNVSQYRGHQHILKYIILEDQQYRRSGIDSSYRQCKQIIYRQSGIDRSFRP